jgi:hypothetical protein
MSIACDPDFPLDAQAMAVRKVAPLLKWKTLFEMGADAEPVVGFPHRIYWLRHWDLQAAIERPMAVCAEERGWRFLLLTGTEQTQVAPRAAVETWLEDGRWRVSSVRTGTKASSGMRTALEAALDCSKLNDQGYELAYLCCRSLWANALWFRPVTGAGTDWVVPLPYARTPLEPYKVIPASDYWPQLRRLPS